jgi:hypothetical protein
MLIIENSTYNYRFNMVGTTELRAQLQALANDVVSRSRSSFGVSEQPHGASS